MSVGRQEVGRPKLGAGAKTKVVCVRISQADHDALAARFGSAGKALAALVEQGLAEEPRRKRGAAHIAEPVEVLIGQERVKQRETLDALNDGPPVHRHRRGEVIRVDYENGTAKKVYACATCQEELA